MAVAYCSHASLFFVLLLASVSTAAAIELDGGRRKPPPAAPTTPPPPPGLGVFDYYILAIQWPISFCNDVKLSPKDKCEVTSVPILPPIFTMHGVWPSKRVGKPVRSGELFDVTQVTTTSITKMKVYWPDAKVFSKSPTILTYQSFWAHEWEEHGAESGLTQKDYFTLACSLFEKANTVIYPYFKQRAGTTIIIAAMNQAFTPLGIPAAICNNGPRGEQLLELRFNISKSGDFQNYIGSVKDICSSALVHLPSK
ncbi:ribonuclease T2 [Ranunculus cassubicifolius]